MHASCMMHSLMATGGLSASQHNDAYLTCYVRATRNISHGIHICRVPFEYPCGTLPVPFVVLSQYGLSQSRSVVAVASPVDPCLKRGEVSGGPEPTFVILTIGTSAECLNSCSIEPDRSRSLALTCPRTVSCQRKTPAKKVNQESHSQ